MPSSRVNPHTRTRTHRERYGRFVLYIDEQDRLFLRDSQTINDRTRQKIGFCQQLEVAPNPHTGKRRYKWTGRLNFPQPRTHSVNFSGLVLYPSRIAVARAMAAEWLQQRCPPVFAKPDPEQTEEQE